MRRFLARFFKNDSGMTAGEYALIGALIAIVIIAGAKSIGTQTSGNFSNIATKMKA